MLTPILTIDRDTGYVHRASCPLLPTLNTEQGPRYGLEFILANGERLCPCLASVLASALAHTYIQVAAGLHGDSHRRALEFAAALTKESTDFEEFLAKFVASGGNVGKTH